MVLGNRFGVRGLVFVVGAMVGACATPSDEGGQGGYVGGNASAEPSADGFLTFNHEADWEHVRVTIDPKANGAQGKALRGAPKNNQVFVKYWDRWGQIGTNSETSGITRHFP